MNRDFKGVWIPKEIWLRKDLTVSEKILITEIDSLDTGGGCWAANGHFSDLLSRTVPSIGNIISDLCKRGYLVKIDGPRRLLKMAMPHVEMGTPPVPPHVEMGLEPSKNEPYKESNTVNSTTTIPRAKTVWENAKTDLQKFMNHYIEQNLRAMYEEADRERVSGFYRQYSRMFSVLLKTAGSLEVGCKALDCATKYYKKLGFPWGLKALNLNWGDFVNAAIEELKRR